MKVKLPKRCTGQQILDAFTAAVADMEAPLESKLVTKQEVDRYEYQPGSVKLVIAGVTCFLNTMRLKKKYIFFGDKVWKEDGVELKFPLINPGKRYSSVYLGIKGLGYVISWYSDEELPENYQTDRPFVEKFLQAFYNHLPQLQQRPKPA